MRIRARLVGLLATVIPVSYTHLDVYKRQVLGVKIRYLRKPRRGCVEAILSKTCFNCEVEDAIVALCDIGG